jgi:hypothetical protein
MGQDKVVHSQYLGFALDHVQLRDRVNKAVRLLRPHADKFEAIAIRGYSGSLVGPAVAMRLRKDLIIIRKPSDNSHSPYQVEGVQAGSYLIVDDQIATGKTINAIKDAVAAWHQPSRLAGIYLYGHGGSTFPEKLYRFGCWGIDGHKGVFHERPTAAIEPGFEAIVLDSATAKMAAEITSFTFSSRSDFPTVNLTI